ncbi:sensor histidine kinase [Streptomyces zingiberis]|uniref:histidine kinase n=1 Tax=Streptomyces zingiberis TaxID=2053010 RepID=A0ABX1C497_9ACTN|nr:HAMP domain-containing sensor histidine kinase [Streptomyces zingiberis]NJQ03470.1 HAMP domain-containing histidine kinase [Streptomyces zingiberis]
MTLRGWHARLSLGIALLTALAFALPLAYLADRQAAHRAHQLSERRAATLVTVLGATRQPAEVRAAWRSSGDDAASTCVRLDGAPVGRCPAPAAYAARAAGERRAMRVRPPGREEVLLLPVALPEGGTAVVESAVREGERTDGVLTAWAVLAAAVGALTLASVTGADRMARRLNRSATDLARAATSVGQGDFAVRVAAEGPREVRSVARAFNTMADRIDELIRSERELLADLSHRLRTPLTALRLEADLLAVPANSRLRAGLAALDREVTSLISTTRSGPVRGGGPDGPHSDLPAVVGDRMAFWSALAEAQGRECRVRLGRGPLPVDLPADDLTAALDALLGNVLRHTPPGTGCGVQAGLLSGAPRLVVEDAGPGIDSPALAAVRGASPGGSSGLGLDIAAKAAEAAGGRLVVDRSPWGGARVTMVFGPVEAGGGEPSAAGGGGRYGGRGPSRDGARGGGGPGGRDGKGPH